MGTVVTGTQGVDNGIMPVSQGTKKQSVSGSDFGSIMAKSVGNNAGKKNSSSANTLSYNPVRTNKDVADKNSVSQKTAAADKTNATDTDKVQNAKKDNDISTKADKAGSEVYDKIKKTLDVSDEELKSSMEKLGLTMADLLMPENIMQLVMDVTGTDDSMLLVTDDMLSNAMKDILNFASAVTEQLAQDLSVTTDDLKEILGDISQSSNQQTEDIQKTVQPEDAAVDNASSLEQVIAGKLKSAQTSSENGTQSSDDGKSQSGKQPVQTEGNINPFAADTAITTNVVEDFAAALENSGVNETDILNQVIDQVKITANEDVKSMEIQLTPETLGKVNVLVSVREGVVTAQLNVQNEQVKKALENQMLTLKENFENQGVKVESVEITVQTNAFESNQNFNNQNEQQNQTSKSRAKINLSGLSLDDEDEEDADNANLLVNENSSVEYIA